MASPFDTVKRRRDNASMSPAIRAGVRDDLLAAARAELTEHGSAAISLRAVARRAGLSHAAPKYHFGDRSGLLTAIATEGFVTLADRLAEVDEPDPQRRLAAMGAVYIDFGLSHRALFELMFRPGELHTDDPELIAGQERAIGALTAVVRRTGGDDGDDAPPTLALMSWALVHGLVALTRDGALHAADPHHGGPAELAHGIADLFSRYVGNDLT
jgi:AcrR family transcriptional regulator